MEFMLTLFTLALFAGAMVIIEDANIRLIFGAAFVALSAYYFNSLIQNANYRNQIINSVRTELCGEIREYQKWLKCAQNSAYKSPEELLQKHSNEWINMLEDYGELLGLDASLASKLRQRENQIIIKNPSADSNDIKEQEELISEIRKYVQAHCLSDTIKRQTWLKKAIKCGKKENKLSYSRIKISANGLLVLDESVKIKPLEKESNTKQEHSS